MNWISPNKAAQFEKLNEHRGSVKKNFKVKDATTVDPDLITHLKKRKGNPKPESEGKTPTEASIKDAETDAKALYDKALKVGNDGDTSVQENAEKLTGWKPYLLEGAKKTTAFLLKAACIGGLVGAANMVTPPLGMALVAADMAAQEFPETLKKLKNISPLQNIRDTIDNALIDDDSNEVAHRVVAKAFTQQTGEGDSATGNKVDILKALRADQAAILGLDDPDHFIMKALDDAAGEAEKTVKDLKEKDITKEEDTTIEAEIRAKMQKASDVDDAEEDAEAAIKEKRLLVVRALTENTDLKEVLNNKAGNKDHIQKFLDLEPTQMRQVIEAFHQKGFNPDKGDYKNFDKENIEKFKKFDKVMELVQTNKEGKTLKVTVDTAVKEALDALPKDATDEKKKETREKTEKEATKNFKADIQENDNALGDALWQHETHGALRLVGMTGRKIWQKSKAVRDTLIQWSPQMKTVAAVGAMAAGHAAVGHFKPKTS